MTTKETLPFAAYDEYEICKIQAEILRECDPDMTEEQAFNIVSQDIDLFMMEWEYFKEVVDEMFFNADDYRFYNVEASNMGWRNLSGEMFVELEDTGDFIRKCLPETEMTIKVFRGSEGVTFVVYHHDSPTGESYRVTPVVPVEDVEGAEKTFKDLVLQEFGNEEPSEEERDKFIRKVSEKDLLEIGRELEDYYMDELTTLDYWIDEIYE